MIRDITIGQYYLTDSVIHKLDPRVKVVCTFAYIISLFCFNQLSGYIIAAVFFLCVIKLSKVPFKFVVRGIKPVLFMLVFTAMLNLFWRQCHCKVWNNNYNRRRYRKNSIYGIKANIPYNRVFNYDTNNNA